MDNTKRQITTITRDVTKFTVRLLKQKVWDQNEQTKAD